MSRPSVATVPGKVILLGGARGGAMGTRPSAVPLDRGGAGARRARPRAAAEDRAGLGAAAVQAALEELAEAFGRPPGRGLHRQLDPLSAGLGSSAAVAVALARALAGAANRSLERPGASRDWRSAWSRRFHGRPSGIDHTTCALAAPLRFVRGQPKHDVRLLRVPALSWVVALSGPRQGTREKVAALAATYEREPERIGAIFRHIGTLAEEGRDLTGERATSPPRRADEREPDRLAGLGLSTATIDALCTATARGRRVGRQAHRSGRRRRGDRSPPRARSPWFDSSSATASARSRRPGTAQR